MKKIRLTKSKRNTALIFVIGFALIGIAALLITRAASPTAHFEAESATRSGNASQSGDSTASGGSFLQFGSSGGPTGPLVTLPNSVNIASTCQNIDSNRANSTYVRQQYARDATTGPEAGGFNEDRMPPSGRSGDWTISTAGTVVEKVYHYGTITVTAPNVTIRNSVICGANHRIIVASGGNLTIENSIVRGERGKSIDQYGSPCGVTIEPANYKIIRSELTGCSDHAKVGGTFESHDSWYHDAYNGRRSGGSGTHNDTWQWGENQNLSSFIVTGNAAYGDYCTSNAHIWLGHESGGRSVANVRADRNFFYGLHGNAMSHDKYPTTAYGSFTNNVFAGSRTRGPFEAGLYKGGGWTNITQSNNTFESGEPAGGRAAGYQCVSG